MNELVKIRVKNVLKAEARLIIGSGEDVQAKVDKMNDITNLVKIIDNYDELEPLLKEFYKEKSKKEKWEER